MNTISITISISGLHETETMFKVNIDKDILSGYRVGPPIQFDARNVELYEIRHRKLDRRNSYLNAITGTIAGMLEEALDGGVPPGLTIP